MFGGTPSWSGVRGLAEAEAQAWYDHVTTDGNPHHWAIEDEDRFIGTARLHGLDEHDRRARYAIGILDGSLLGRGIGRDVTLSVLGYAFGDLGLTASTCASWPSMSEPLAAIGDAASSRRRA